MKSNEIRQGNLLNHQESECVEVITIHSDSTIRYNWQGKEYGCYHIKQFSPIRPTEQWLLNFGFENIGIDKITFCDTYVLNDIKLSISNSGNIYYGKLFIGSVHALQNLYFALKNEELILK